MRRGSLADERPELIPQWGTINELSPSDVSCGSHKKVWWVCDKGHTWEATVKNRALIGSGCPYCEHRAVLKGFNDLQTSFPDIARTWSAKNDITPDTVSSRSNSEVLWQCEKGHEWKARVADRTEGHGCPYCAGQRVWTGYNDLATTHPALVAEWSDKNKGISPKTITYKNRSNVWWHCKRCGNDYMAVVYARANGRICPFCIAYELRLQREQKMQTKQISKDFNYLLPQLASIYYAGKKGLQAITESEEPVGIIITAFIPDIGLAIGVCCSSKIRTIKEYICNTKGITYVNIPVKLSEIETVNMVRDAFLKTHIYFDSSAEEDLEILRNRFVQWKNRCKSSP